MMGYCCRFFRMSHKFRSAVSLMAVLLFAAVTLAQTPDASMLFQADFEADGPLPRKDFGGATRDESVTIEQGQAFEGQQNLQIKFTPSDSRFWYYRMPVNMTATRGKYIVLEGNIKFETQGAPTPVARALLGITYNVYADPQFTQLLSADSVIRAGTAPATDEWTFLQSPPTDIAGHRSELAGGKDVYVKITGVFIGVTDSKLEQPVTLSVDAIRMFVADDAYMQAQREKLYDNYEPLTFATQTNYFPHGFWGNLGSGHYSWFPYLQFIPKQQRYLCAVETLLAANANTIFSDQITSDDPAMLDEVVQAQRLADRWGIRTIAIAYLTPYYDSSRSMETCEKQVENVVNRLKNEPGILAYYPIDEPRGDEQTMEYWLWAKRTFNAIDPTRPVTGAQNTLSTIRFYAPTEHTLNMDIYPLEVPKSQRFDKLEGGQIPFLKTCLEAAHEGGAQAVWPIIWSAGTTFSENFYARIPSPAETELMSYICLAHGGRGLMHFAFVSRMCPSTKMREGLVSCFNSVYEPQYAFSEEIMRLGNVVPIEGPALLHTLWDPEVVLPVTSQTVHVEGGGDMPAIGYGYNRGDAYDVLVCYNWDTKQNQSAELAIPAELRNGRNVYDLSVDQVVASDADDHWVATFEPGGGKIYIVATPQAYRQVRSACLERESNFVARRVRFLLPELENNGVNVDAIRARLDEAKQKAAANPEDAYEPYLLVRDAELEASRLAGANAELTHARKLMESIRQRYTAMNNIYSLHIADHHADMDLTGDPRWRAWGVGMVQISDALILLRNAVYAGKLEAATPLLEQLDELLRQTQQSVNNGDFEVSDTSLAAKILEQAKAMNISAIDLLMEASAEDAD